MEAKRKKILKLMSVLNFKDQFIFDYLPYFNNVQLDEYLSKLTERKNELKRDLDRANNLFLKINSYE